MHAATDSGGDVHQRVKRETRHPAAKQVVNSRLGPELTEVAVEGSLPELVFAMYSRADGALTPPARMLAPTLRTQRGRVA